MSKQTDLAVLRRLEAEYAPATSRFELEDWLAQQLWDTYHGVADDSCLFRFKETAIVYVPKSEFISITKLVGSKAIDYSIPLRSFLLKNYGVESLKTDGDIDMALMLTENDFELMAMQLTQDILEWCELWSCMALLAEKNRL